MSDSGSAVNNDKIKYIFLGVLGVAAVVVALYLVVVGPMQTKKATMKTELEELNTNLDRASVKVGRMQTIVERKTKQHEEIYNISERYILHHQLGNYFIQVKEYLSLVALDSEIQIVDILESGIDVYPKPATRKSENSLKLYNVRLNMVGGLHSLIKFLKYIETDNSYIVVSSVRITSNESTPGHHKISLNILWPIWENDELLEKYSNLLEEDINEN
ncbi:MAG: hypothetical protein PF692_02850 [Kiritimatiellae bacterium]|jgi:Tfp pilus assembly protein PilO|nr:hypothetical protein [Kiritimatiellia bacterium]